MMNDENFFQRVYEVTRQIPWGRVTSYGAIARCIGSPGASRMVGWALNNSHTQEEFIPAHRVVNRNGLLTGKHHFRHQGLMQELLENEGIKVEKDRVVNFSALFWDPCSNLI
jgi:methylated-DNA-protein-cysteine methyltransferase related protein